MGSIISASRRTDLPAFYAGWFFHRLEEGYALVRNPMNPRQLRRVSLIPDEVDGFVFWSKNPAPMLPYLSLLKDYAYYFQFTLNGYGGEIEPGLPSTQALLETFSQLSDQIGPERVLWRYDPIFLSPSFPLEYHVLQFELLARRLESKTKQCTVSFIDPYAKKAKNFRKYQLRELKTEEMEEAARQLSRIAMNYGIKLKTCAEQIDLERYGIAHGRCVDASLLSELAGRKIAAVRDSGQRKACGCDASLDIGAYNTCTHGCRYCYASGSDAAVLRRVQECDPLSPLLCGHPE